MENVAKFNAEATGDAYVYNIRLMMRFGVFLGVDYQYPSHLKEKMLTIDFNDTIIASRFVALLYNYEQF